MWRTLVRAGMNMVVAMNESDFASKVMSCAFFTGAEEILVSGAWQKSFSARATDRLRVFLRARLARSQGDTASAAVVVVPQPVEEAR